eukprot:919593_1
MSSDQVACFQLGSTSQSSAPLQPIAEPSSIFRIPEAPSKGFLQHTTTYLFCGYIRRNCCHLALPTVINNLICSFFVGKNWKQIKFDDIISTSVTEYHQKKLYETILNIICPGTNPSNEYWLSKMIDYIPGTCDLTHAKAYVEVLFILTDYCDVYFSADQDKYNDLLIHALWRLVPDIPNVLPVFCKLLGQYVGYYTILSNIVNTFDSVRRPRSNNSDHYALTWSKVNSIDRFTTTTDISNVRRLFGALLYNSIPNNQTIFAMFLSWRWDIKARHDMHKTLQWIWLRAEIVYFVSHSHDSLPNDSLQLLLDKLATMLLNAENEVNASE